MTALRRPLVTYRCVVGHALRLAGIVSDDGRPLYGFWDAKRPGVKGTPWIEHLYLDGPGTVLLARQDPVSLIDGAYVRCPTHGVWTIPREEMLNHWRTARASRPLTIRLDNTSP